jgi:hypothetical protein
MCPSSAGTSTGSICPLAGPRGARVPILIARVSTFCRHNRFTADCPICSKGTVLDAGASRTRRKSSSSAPRKRSGEKGSTPAFSGPYVAGPARRDEDDALYLIRLEKVPGGVRIGEWRGSALAPVAPVLPAEDLADLVARSGDALQTRDAAKLIEALGTAPVEQGGAEAIAGVSRGRSGDFKEELRVEALDDGQLRVARWVLRPAIGWELQDAPPMLPAARYAEALADAARQGLIAAAPASATPQV